VVGTRPVWCAAPERPDRSVTVRGQALRPAASQRTGNPGWARGTSVQGGEALLPPRTLPSVERGARVGCVLPSAVPRRRAPTRPPLPSREGVGG
jgi:hypothetical protein